MAKEKPAAVEAAEPVYLDDGPSVVEATLFLKDPKGTRVCFKYIGGRSTDEYAEGKLAQFYAGGYEPDSFKNGGAAPAPARPSGGGGQPEKKPCPVHEGHFLYLKQNAKGKWYSHKDPDGNGYCNGKEQS